MPGTGRGRRRSAPPACRPRGHSRSSERLRSAGRRASGSLSLALLEHGRQHSSFSSKNRSTATRIGSGRVWYSAASMPRRHIRSFRSTSVYNRAYASSLALASIGFATMRSSASLNLEHVSDQRLAELGLAGEVVVEARLRDVEFLRNVRVAEPVEAADLHEPLGDVEDPRRGVGLSLRFRLRDGHARILHGGVARFRRSASLPS